MKSLAILRVQAIEGFHLVRRRKDCLKGIAAIASFRSNCKKYNLTVGHKSAFCFRNIECALEGPQARIEAGECTQWELAAADCVLKRLRAVRTIRLFAHPTEKREFPECERAHRIYARAYLYGCIFSTYRIGAASLRQIASTGFLPILFFCYLKMHAR